MDVVIDWTAALAATGCGLMAGLFFAFSVAVMPALARVPDPAAISAMKSINIVIVRPLFLLVFLGAAVLCAGLAVLAPQPLHLIAAAMYLIGSIGVTAAVNVPLNNALDVLAVDTAESAHWWRQRYLSRWTAANHVRTAACTAASLALFA